MRHVCHSSRFELIDRLNSSAHDVDATVRIVVVNCNEVGDAVKVSFGVEDDGGDIER